MKHIFIYALEGPRVFLSSTHAGEAGMNRFASSPTSPIVGLPGAIIAFPQFRRSTISQRNGTFAGHPGPSRRRRVQRPTINPRETVNIRDSLCREEVPSRDPFRNLGLRA
jgi:hypothetical protein